MSLCKASDPLVGAIFWPQRYNVNNLGRGLLDESADKILKAWV